MRTKPKPSREDNRRRSEPSDKNKNKSTPKDTTFPCDVCNHIAKNERDLDTHLENIHKFCRVNKQRKDYSQDERRMNGRCLNWNNNRCRFLDACKFAHEEIPQCHFDGRCSKNNCRFFHKQPKSDGPSSFLYPGGPRNHPYQSQGRNLGWGHGGQHFRR